MSGEDALLITAIVLYSTGHWIGGTVSLAVLLFLSG
jgi:hypothetical protein